MTRNVVLTSYYRPKPGGLCKRYFKAINALLMQGAEVHYLAVEKFPVDHPNCFFHKFIWPKGQTDNLLFWMCFHVISPLLLLYIGYKYKITHAFAFGSTYAFVLQPLHILKNIPLSLFIRADAILNHSISGHAKWIIIFEKFFEGFAIRDVQLYGVSDALTRAIVERHKVFKPKLSDTFRNNIEYSNSTIKKQRTSPLILGCVGVLEKRKNQELLLQAISKLPKRSVKLYIYGTGPEEQTLVDLAHKLNIIDYVIFKGWVSAEIIWTEIDVLAVPSLHEGAPNVVLEALSNEIPVIASNIPEHAEILPKKFLLSLDSIEGWTNKIADLINDNGLLDEIVDSQKINSKLLYFDWEQQITLRIVGVQT